MKKAMITAVSVAGVAAFGGVLLAVSANPEVPEAAEQAPTSTSTSTTTTTTTNATLTCSFGEGLNGYNNVTVNTSDYPADYDNADPATILVTDNSGTTFGYDFWAYRSVFGLVLPLPASPYADSYADCSIKVGPHSDNQDWYFVEVAGSASSAPTSGLGSAPQAAEETANPTIDELAAVERAGSVYERALGADWAPGDNPIALFDSHTAEELDEICAWVAQNWHANPIEAHSALVEWAWETGVVGSNAAGGTYADIVVQECGYDHTLAW